MNYHEKSTNDDVDYRKSGLTFAAILMLFYVIMFNNSTFAVGINM